MSKVGFNMAKLNEKKMIDEIRLLALDMIDNAGSGHPGICLSAAPMMYSLFANHLNYDVEKTDWPNRDRFVLSVGHASALLYATLYAMTEDYTIDELEHEADNRMYEAKEQHYKKAGIDRRKK